MDNFTKAADLKLDCENGVPYLKEFFDGLVGAKSFVLIYPLSICVLILCNYFRSYKNLIGNCPKHIKPNCISLISIYPIVSVCSLIAIAIPRTYFFMDTIGHVAFMIISYQLYRLCMIYVEGESNFISVSNKEAFSLKTPPFCCCCPLGRSPVTKNKFCFIRFLILQMPVAHIAIFLVLNMIYIEDVRTFDQVILYFIPLIALTVLGGIWGFNVAIRMMAPFYSNLKLPQKYFAFQLVLFFCKIQPIFLNLLMKQMMTSCTFPFTIVVKRHSKAHKTMMISSITLSIFFAAVIQFFVQTEMLLLSSWASVLYKNPLPGN